MTATVSHTSRDRRRRRGANAEGESLSAAEAVHVAQRAAAPWPYAELNVARLRADGWRPVAIREVVLKVHQRCNLACDYCYVYTQADQSWRQRPAAMPDEIWRAAVERIGSHVRRHSAAGIRVVLHGGEPLLFGTDRLARLADELRAGMPRGATVEIGLQTNGILLDAPMLRVLCQRGISIGVSLDGGPAEHDRRRTTAAGRGSYAAAEAALDLLRRPEYRASYAGILCTVAPDTNPVACYEHVRAFEPPMIDFLLPHANWQHPPLPAGGDATLYGDWLVAVFDQWYDSADGTRIRLFESVIDLLLGGASRSEQVGLSPACIVVVESDGAIEQVDALKSAYQGACATGLDIRHHDLDAVFDDPGIVARQLGLGALSRTCLQCPVHRVCGAGHYAHRYDPATGFRNPSVYCQDLRRLIDHVRDRVVADIRQRTAASVP